MQRRILKERAKLILGGRIFSDTWLLALLALAIADAIHSLAGTVLPGVGALLVTGPMALGSSYVILKLVRTRQKIDFKDLFAGFSQDIGQNILLGFLSSLFVALWSLLFVIPGIVKAYGYGMIYYIKADHPEYDWRTCLHASQQMMYGHKMDLFVLDLSFIGWEFLIAISAGILGIWIMPYIYTTYAMYYNMLVYPDGVFPTLATDEENEQM